MNFRRATTSAAIGVALAIGAATPAHAARTLWVNYPFAPGQTMASPSGELTSVVGVSPSGYTFKIAVHKPGGWDLAMPWIQVTGNMCIYWTDGTKNVGELLNNPLTFPQQLWGYTNTAGTMC